MVIGLSPTALADGKPGYTLFREPLINCLDGRIAVLGATHKLGYLFYLYDNYPARGLALRVAASGAQPKRQSPMLRCAHLALHFLRLITRRFLLKGSLSIFEIRMLVLNILRILCTGNYWILVHTCYYSRTINNSKKG